MYLCEGINCCFYCRTDRKVKGVYAVSVSGRLPDSLIRDMKARGITYRSRDTSQRQ